MLIVGIGVTFALHCLLQLVLYPSTGLHVVAANGLAVASYAVLLSRWTRDREMGEASRAALVVVLTLVIGFFSFWGSLLLPFNMFGT